MENMGRGRWRKRRRRRRRWSGDGGVVVMERAEALPFGVDLGGRHDHGPGGPEVHGECSWMEKTGAEAKLVRRSEEWFG